MERYDRKLHLKWFLINVGLFWGLIFFDPLVLSPLGLGPPYLLRWPTHTIVHLGIISTLSYYYKEKKKIKFTKLLLLGIFYDMGFYAYTAILIGEFVLYKLAAYQILLQPYFKQTTYALLIITLAIQSIFLILRYFRFMTAP